MANKFTLKCFGYTPSHVRFYLYDPTGYHCGTVVLNEEHLDLFLKQVWRGKIDWGNEKGPDEKSMKKAKIDSNKKTSN